MTVVKSFSGRPSFALPRRAVDFFRPARRQHLREEVGMPIEQLQQQDGRFGRLPDAAFILVFTTHHTL